MYVAVTRAKSRLFLTHAKSRFLYGETRYCIPSRFLVESGLVARPERKEDVFTASPSHTYSPYNAQSGYAQSRSVGGGTVGIGGNSYSATYKSDFGKKAQTAPQQQSTNKSEIVAGATVMHKRLGKGKIIDIEKMGDSLYAKIDFERGGVMLLAVDFAPITVIKD